MESPHQAIAEHARVAMTPTSPNATPAAESPRANSDQSRHNAGRTRGVAV
jgi:hypothetical protein